MNAETALREALRAEMGWSDIEVDDFLTEHNLRAALAPAPTLDVERLRHLLAVALDPADDEAHEWCDVDSDGYHRFDSESFEREAREYAALAALDASIAEVTK